MLVRVKKHPTLGVLVASNGMVYNRVGSSQTYKWTFGCVNQKRGYAYVHVGGKYRSVHRIIAETFLDNPEHKPWIDHISRDRLDNNVCNIQWCTPTENHLNMETSTGFGELSSIDKNKYHRVLMTIPKHRDKRRENDKKAYLAKREAGFHYVTGADGKRHWEKI